MQSPTLRTAARVKNPLPEGPLDVAIVGCGLGGLEAGALLARRGFKVACFDSHYVAGGCATMFERGRSDRRFRFDIGLHYVGDCGKDGAVMRLLGEAGVDVDWVPMDPDGFDTLVFPDFRFRIPASRDVFRDRLLAMWPKEKRGIDRYVRFLREVEHIQTRMDQSRGKLGWAGKIDALINGRLAARYQNATISQVLDDCTRDPHVRAVMLGQSGDYGVAPSKVSALLHAGLTNHYFRGAYYPKGGGQVIADRLADVIEAHGGSIHLRCGVERILVENGRAVGVRTEGKAGGDGAEVRAKVVLSGADLKRTLLELVGPQHLPASWVTRAQGFEMGAAIFLMVLGVEGNLTDHGLGATNLWQYDGYDFDAYYLTPFRPGDVDLRGCYITSATSKDPSSTGHAPAGHGTVEVMTLVPGDPRLWGVDPVDIDSGRYRKAPAYVAQKARIEQDLVARFDKLVPGAAKSIVLQESATPVTHTRYTRASDGTGYGLAATPAQFMGGRPGYRAPVAGLYLCGASTRAGHGVVGALQGGQRAATRIAEDLGRAMAGA